MFSGFLAKKLNLVNRVCIIVIGKKTANPVTIAAMILKMCICLSAKRTMQTVIISGIKQIKP